MRWLLGLLLLIVIALIIFVLRLVKKEEAKLKKEQLLKKKERLKELNKQKELLRDFLEQKFNRQLYPRYTALLIAFLSVSYAFSLFFVQGFEFGALLNGAVITEGVIFVITLYIIKKPVEFSYLMSQFAPFFKKKVYGENFNIESEIDRNYSKINKIDKKVKKLDKVIFAYS